MVLVVAAVALVAMLAGAGLRGAADPAPPTAPVPAPADHAVAAGSEDERPSTGPGPWAAAGGVGVGFSRDEAGALAAAVSYATAPQVWLYRSDAQVTASFEVLASEDAEDDLVDQVVEDAGLLRAEVSKASGTVWFVVAPLATKVETFTEDRAVVRVWLVRVLSADGVAVPQSGWATLTLDLSWERGDWRLASVDESEGPTPQVEAGSQPWAADYLGGELDGFRRVGVS